MAKSGAVPFFFGAFVALPVATPGPPSIVSLPRPMTIPNRSAGPQHTGSKADLEIIALSATLLSVVASFVAGSLLGEDSTGGMRADFYNFHWPAIEHFSALSWGTAIAKDYPVSNNPLLYMIASLLPLHGNQKIYHAITFLIALLIWPLLAWAYHRRYSNYGIGWLWALFGASAILISPSFRSSAFWGTTDYLPIAFCVGTSLLLSRFQDLGVHEARTIPPSTLVTLAFISSCAFYTRQFYAFLPVFAAWTVLTRTKTAPFLVFGVFFMALLPELFLIYVWKGINAPSNQFVFHPTLTNVALVGCNIAFVSTPLILGCIRRPFGDVFPEWWGARATALAFVGLFVFITALWPTEWPSVGGGIIAKTGVRMGALGTPFILTVSYLGLAAAFLFSVRSATNAVLAGAFVVPFFTDRFSYQHYLEPSLAVAVFLFADTQTAKAVFNKRVLICNFAFSLLVLVIAIVYYDLFLSVTSIPFHTTG